MTTDHELIQSLKQVTEKLTNKTLSQAELSYLKKLFNESEGTPYERARKAIQLFSGVSESQILKNTAASDNLDRIMRELEQTAAGWKPGT